MSLAMLVAGTSSSSTSITDRIYALVQKRERLHATSSSKEWKVTNLISSIPPVPHARWALETKKDSKGVETYKQLVSSIRFVSNDYFSQTQVSRILAHCLPAIRLQECELHDTTFYYLLLEMLGLKQKQKQLPPSLTTPHSVGVAG